MNSLLKHEAKELLYEVDDLLGVILKGDKWEAMANRLSNLLLKKWDKEQKSAIIETIDLLIQGEGYISDEEMEIAVNTLEAKLGTSIFEAMRKDIETISLESYTKGHADIGIQFEFNTVDKKALYWLTQKDVKQFWIGDSYNTWINKFLNEMSAEVMKQGMGRVDAGKYFESILSEGFSRKRNYWELLAEHVVTRSREFGKVSAYEKAGISEVKIVAVIDHRTSAICRFLNGKVINVNKLVKQRDELMRAKTLKQIKKLAPWYSDRQVEIFEGKNPDKIPSSIGLPPYHARCRTRTVSLK